MTRLMSIRQILLSLSLSLTFIMIGSVMPGVVASVTPAYAQAYDRQVSDEFVAAVTPYGEWRRHPRWGDIWVPFNRPPGWRPYTYGQWVYTDDWGWYWISDDEEADWGWVAYHYGRWAYEPRLGWFWVPGDEWAPAWVDWRRGDDYLGWAPLPPEPLIDSDEYIENPSYWIFVEPRHFTQVRIFTFVIPPHQVLPILHRTVLVNRTVRFDRDHRRVAVNPGISPAVVAAIAHNPIPTYHVRPQVLRATQGVAGARVVRPLDLIQRGERGGPQGHRFQTEIQPTAAVIQPAASVPKAEPLRRGEQGRLGTHPPRAGQEAIAPASAPAVVPMQQPPQAQPKPPQAQPKPPQQAQPMAPVQHGDQNHPRGEPNSSAGVVAPKPPVTRPAPSVRQVAPPPPAAPRIVPAPVAAPPATPPPAHAPAPAVHAQPVMRQAAPPPNMQRTAAPARAPGPPPAASTPGAQKARPNEKQRQHRPGEPEQPK